ncbi:chromosomal replication initiation protein DnaA, partial [Micrococcus endophyticus]
MVADQAVLSSWRSVVGALEDDARVSARLMGFVYLAQPQGLIGNTLLLAVPNETTRETLQGAQVAEALTDALTAEFREEILLAISIDANLQPPRAPEPEARRSAL